MPNDELSDLERRLATIGVDTARGLALDATITRETFAGSAAHAPASAPSRSDALPRIALSGRAFGKPASFGTAPADADLEILGVLGEGGMGRVHLARQRSFGREVAIKTIRDEVADARASDMLRDEALIMGRLEHPNVVPVHAVGVDGEGRLVLVMKRIEGAPWRELLRDPQHPRWAALAPRPEDRPEVHLTVLAQVANALELAHTRGVIHRDVKPDNVLLGLHGEVYLADWGVALSSSSGAADELVGTPAYMAPEMVVPGAQPIDARTDVYLLGASLHEVLTGEPPHRGSTLTATLRVAFESAPFPYGATVAPELAAIARRAMARSPQDRFGSALEFRRAIDELRTHRTSIALARSGRELLAELEHATQGGEATRGGIDRKLTECRFALVAALREWPGNEDARLALGKCLRLSIRNEIAREGADAARALLAELDGEDADLAHEIAALEARLAARRADAARLRSLEADGDLRVGFGARAVFFAVFFAASLTISTIAVSSGSQRLAGWDIVRFAAVMLAVVVAIGGLLARRLMANAAGRQVMVLLVLANAGLLVHRVIAAINGVPVATTLAMDLVLLGMITAGAGSLVRHAVWSTVPIAIGVALAMAFPDRAPIIFSSCALLTTAMVLGLWLLAQRAR